MNIDLSKAGYVHSIDTCGMVDGPGIRYLVFFSGCALRCMYCHNPDTWDKKSGTEMTVAECMTEIMKYKSYYRFSGGGVTISGGEPLHQHEFLLELLKACREKGINTALDTTGFASLDVAKAILPFVDLLLLDIKSYNPQMHKILTGVEMDKPIAFLKQSQVLGVSTWIRYVLVPGLTDNKDDIKKLAIFLKRFDNIEKVHVLPFHKHGEHKWAEIGVKYELHDTQIPTQAQVDEVQALLDIKGDFT